MAATAATPSSPPGASPAAAPTPRVRLCLYTGPGTTLAHRLAHLITVLVLTLRERRWCPYSHAELEIDGICYSSSVRDGGVRPKAIDTTTGHWRVYTLPTTGPGAVNVPLALARFKSRQGMGYDWPGALAWGLPFLRQRPSRYYCFELVAYMLGLPHPAKQSPLDIRDHFIEQWEQ